MITVSSWWLLAAGAALLLAVMLISWAISGWSRERQANDALIEHGSLTVTALAELALGLDAPPEAVRAAIDAWDPEALAGRGRAVSELVARLVDDDAAADRVRERLDLRRPTPPWPEDTSTAARRRPRPFLPREGV